MKMRQSSWVFTVQIRHKVSYSWSESKVPETSQMTFIRQQCTARRLISTPDIYGLP